jgi:hypothetical protein
MSNDLNRLASEFSASKPVFKIELKYKATYIEFNLKDKYDPKQDATDDPVSQLLASHWYENYDRDSRCFTPTVDTQKAYGVIVDKVTEFYVENSELKNPNQSKLYKWLRTQPGNQGYNCPTGDGFIALYRYINNNGLQEKCYGVENEHVKNVIAILELMRNKYEGK